MNKKEQLINTIKQQLNVELKNDKEDMFNQNRNILYTEISRNDKLLVLGYLIKNNIAYCELVRGKNKISDEQV